MLSSQDLNLHQVVYGAAQMLTSAQIERFSRRSFNLLKSINEDDSSSEPERDSDKRLRNKVRGILKRSKKPKSRAKSKFEYSKGAAGLQQMAQRAKDGKMSTGNVKVGRGRSVERQVQALENLIRSMHEARQFALGHHDAHSLSVPAGLRESLSLTARRLVMEASPGTRKRRKAAYDAHVSDAKANGEKPMTQKGFETKDWPDEKKEKRNTRERKAGAKREAKKKAVRKADGSSRGKPRGGGPRPPAPPAAGAQAVGGDQPTPARKAADKKGTAPVLKPEKLPAFKGKGSPFPERPPEIDHDTMHRVLTHLAGLAKSGKLLPDSPPAEPEQNPYTYRGGRRMRSGARGGRNETLPTFKKRVASGEVNPDQSGRDISPDQPATTLGRRWRTTAHPEDVRKGLSPDEHARQQEKRKAGHAWQEKQRQERGKGRSMGAVGAGDYHAYAGHDREGDFEPAKLRSNISKLRRERMKLPGERQEKEGRRHDTAKGHFIKKREDPDKPGKVTSTEPEHEKWAGHYKDSSTGEIKHGSGKKENKKFANAMTFSASDDDAMLHTDKDREGSRGEADDDQFAKVGDTASDPRKKWYRVSKEGGLASAMGSLRQAYAHDDDVKEKVIDKVRSTGFVDRKGHQADIRPTGDLHGNRECSGSEGEALKKRDPREHYRLCKGSHDGIGGTKKGRGEYDQGFDPKHDDQGKLKKRHGSAEMGKKFRRKGA